MRRLRLPFKSQKISLPLLAFILLLVVGLGSASWQKTHPKPVPVSEVDAKYISLGGGYLFSIPAKYTSTGAAIPGVTIVYPETLDTLNGKNLEELYKAGAVAAQPIAALKDNNVKAFKDYVSNMLAADLGKTMHSAVDVREAKQGNIPGLRVFALANDGKRLRAIYAVNFTQPVMMVASEESDALKVVGSTVEDLKKTKYKADIDLAVQAAKSVAEMLQKQDASGIRKKATAQFNKNVSKDKLAADLKGATYLDRSITIAGGSYNGKVFIGELIFEPKTKDQSAVSGVVSLSKQGKNWKLDGFQLPQ